MTKKEFTEFTDETIPSALFHVDYKDIDDKTGMKLDEVILINLIQQNITCLKHKPLRWFVEEFIEEKRVEEQQTEFEKRAWNYSFEQGMVVKFADDLPEGMKIWNGGVPLYYDPTDFVDKLAIVIECWCDIHAFSRGSSYYCKLNFGDVIMTAPAQYFVQVKPEDVPNIK